MPESAVDLARVEEQLQDLIVESQRAATAYERGATGEMLAADRTVVAIKDNILATVTRLAEAVGGATEHVKEAAARYQTLWLEHQAAQEDTARLERALDAEQEECATWRMQAERLREALEPFASGGDWGQVKAWIVEGADACGHPREAGIQAAVRIGKWQVTVDAALAPLPRPTPEPERDLPQSLMGIDPDYTPTPTGREPRGCPTPGACSCPPTPETTG